MCDEVDTDVWPVPAILDDFVLNIAAPGYCSEPPIIKWDPNWPLYKLFPLFGNISLTKLKSIAWVHFISNSFMSFFSIPISIWEVEVNNEGSFSVPVVW